MDSQKPVEVEQAEVPPGLPANVSRESLYSDVWAEPMLRVGANFGVSSSYMARICTLMNVPRPERGYWAKLAVGKAPPQPPLTERRLGHTMPESTETSQE